jgi:hypothetical protein
MLFEEIEEVVYVPDIARKAIETIDDDDIDLTLANSFQQFLKAGPVAVLAAGNVFTNKRAAPTLHLGVVAGSLPLVVK